MQAKAFRIQNFRSVVDTGWQDLSPDDITVIVGQNESGKSTTLDAIHSFEKATIKEDDLRSDESMPSVSLSFHIDFPTEIIEILPQIPKPNLKGIERINLKREWYFDESKQIKSKIILEEENLIKQFPIIYEADNEEKELTSDEFAREVFGYTPTISFFSEDVSILPSTIDLKDLKDKNSKAKGKRAVENFIKLSGISVDTLLSSGPRIVNRHLSESNTTITSEFQKFWNQTVGSKSIIELECTLNNHPASSGAQAGEPYLTFWIKDSSETLYPKQRSKGVLWFLSFFLELYTSTKEEQYGKPLILIDEPGASLHAKAQGSVLAVLEAIKEKIAIMYTTHSPYLVKVDNLYRILAVQRNELANGYAATVLIPAHRLGQANIDTLLPVYTAMGLGIHQHSAIPMSKNIILEEISAFYYIKSFEQLLGISKGNAYLPAQGATNVPTIANLLLGWGINFAVAVDDDSTGRKVYNNLKSHLCYDDDNMASKKLLKLPTGPGIENAFSESDFDSIVAKDFELKSGIPNSEKAKDKPKAIIAARFKMRVDAKEINRTTLSEESLHNIEKILKALHNLDC